MLWLKPYVVRIREHLAAGTDERLTYGALECRLAIERICYERLRVSYDYVSERDLRPRWTPKHVIDFLVAEANELATTEFTLSISTKPVTTPESVLDVADFEAQEYVPIGTQVSFDPKLMGRLWQALSSFLHVRMPHAKDDELETYGDASALAAKLREAIAELERLSNGTLVSSAFGQTVSFECRCGLTNKRQVSLLKPGSVLSCANPTCKERYRVSALPEDNFEFERVTVEINCRHCGSPGHFGEHEVVGIGLNRIATYDCGNCGEQNQILWKLMQANKVSAASESGSTD